MTGICLYAFYIEHIWSVFLLYYGDSWLLEVLLESFIHPVLKASSYQFSLDFFTSSADITSYWFNFRQALESPTFLSVNVSWVWMCGAHREGSFWSCVPLPPAPPPSPHLMLSASLPPNLHSCYQSFPKTNLCQILLKNLPPPALKSDSLALAFTMLI